MPRPQRKDLEPSIYMKDFSAITSKAKEAVREHPVSVSVHQRGRPIYYMRSYAAYEAWLDFLRGEEEKIDFEILTYMSNNIDLADTRLENLPPNDDGLSLYRLVRVGCRVRVKQSEIADALSCSVERVRLAIKQLKRCMIIVNSGNGWYEFDANFFWKGAESARVAYLDFQLDMQYFDVVCEER